MIELALNLETCIRCTELSYDVADGLGDDLRAELALLRQVHADAYALVCTFPATRLWTPQEAALAASQAALRNLVNARPELPPAASPERGSFSSCKQSPGSKYRRDREIDAPTGAAATGAGGQG